MAPGPPECGVSPELWSCPLPSDIVPSCSLDSKGPTHWGMDFCSWTHRGSSLPPEMGPTWWHQLQSLLEKRNFIVHKGYVVSMGLRSSSSEVFTKKLYIPEVLPSSICHLASQFLYFFREQNLTSRPHQGFLFLLVEFSGAQVTLLAEWLMHTYLVLRAKEQGITPRNGAPKSVLGSWWRTYWS